MKVWDKGSNLHLLPDTLRTALRGPVSCVCWESARYIFEKLPQRFFFFTFVICDGYLVLLPSTLVRGRNVHDTIGVNIKCHLNLRDTSWGWRNACQLKLSKKVIVFGHSSFSLVHLDEYTRLVIWIGGKGLCLFCWNSCVSLDEWGHHTTSCLNTKRQGSNVQQ